MAIDDVPKLDASCLYLRWTTTLNLPQWHPDLLYPVPGRAKVGWGKKFLFGGKGPYGDAEVVVQSIYFYNAALAHEVVNDLYLWGKFQAK